MSKVLMMVSRISFILEGNGFTAWQLHQIKQLTSYFRSIFVLYNITRDQQATLSDTLHVLSIGSCRHDVCQIAIEGLDAELACLVLTEYLRQHATLFASSHTKNASAEAILANHPTFSLPFTIQWHSLLKAEFANQKDCLHYIAQQANSADEPALIRQLLAREAIAATTLPPSIALPHVISEHISTPCLCVLTLAQAINWGSTQAETRFIIGLILPKRNPIKKEEIMAATRLTRWLIESHHQQLLFQQPNETHLKGLLLHIMAH
ncbi:PTS sugar transporter subunit IIA [Vibrio metschnikovii]|uniref:PTS sugar transporter subunit IIA n=1 Tax=Vibrio metschnikovii TaxID=28172 RepID=UPI001C3068A8|nr:PTS sugar transporter subunit IIA [Vibrio metschnikovii]